MTGSGVRHLGVLARSPRPAGSPAEAEARSYVARELAGLGFAVREEPFSYSAFPGRYGTPVGGALVAATALLTSWLALQGASAIWVLASFVIGMGAAMGFARAMLGNGVLDLSLLRARAVNLAATRGTSEPQVWLVAHLDSKSQPISSIVRVMGVALLALCVALCALGVALTLAGLAPRTLWQVAQLASVVGALPVMFSVVGTRSDGAVDNASGVAAVVAAAELLGREVRCGVLIPSAEELGLAGARAWAREHPLATAINCDGVDDDGETVIMYNGAAPPDVVDAVRAATDKPVRVRRMPIGLLTDSTALADAGWRTVTVSHGSLATLRRVHTTRDSLASLRGTSIDDVAVILARAVEALAS